MQLALKEELIHRLICIGDPQVSQIKSKSSAKSTVFSGPVNSCSYVNEAGYLLSTSLE